MGNGSTALALNGETWDAELNGKQRRLVKLIAEKVYDTVKEAGAAAGYKNLESAIYQTVASPTIQRALEQYDRDKATQALDMIQTGKSLIQSRLPAALKELSAAQTVKMGMELVKTGTDNVLAVGEPEPQVSNSAAMQALIDRNLAAYLRCGLERPEVARRILKRLESRK